MKTPNSLSSMTATYSTVISASLQKRKKKHHMMRWDSLSSHGKPHFPLVQVWRLTQFFCLFLWKEKINAWWGEHLISQLTEAYPIFFFFFLTCGVDSPDSAACFSAKETNKTYVMSRVRWSSHGWSHGKTPDSFCVESHTYSDLLHLNLQKKSS